jgi:excisionase family DNA binding protein
MARDGRIPAVKVGRKWRFVREQIIDWLKAGAPAQPRRLIDQ